MNDVTIVLGSYANHWHPISIESLGSAGGFSGAQFWRLETDSVGPLCLRRWPREHPDRQRLEFIHRVLLHVQRNGFDKLAVPIATLDGATIVSHVGYFWELSSWISGNPVADPNAKQVGNALQLLASFHNAAQSFPVQQPIATSPGIAMRRKMIEQLRNGQLDEIRDRAIRSKEDPIVARAMRLIDLFNDCVQPVAHQLGQSGGVTAPLQPCIRDIWRDNVLFNDNEASGIIDFGAMNIESVSADVARLLGSFARDDAQQWQTGLNAYEEIRPLSIEEKLLVPIFDQANVLLSGMNWLRWIYLDNRRFDEPSRVLNRLDEMTGRLAQVPQQPM